ncbi:MAG: hypothetical protein P8Q42_01230 [Flavobacteriales bacterium]|nr:hypothetical protein [Flavobacteriales bacterium]
MYEQQIMDSFFKISVLIISFILMLQSCTSLKPAGKVNKISEETLESYVGKPFDILLEDYKIKTCNLKVAYFNDVYAVKMRLKNNQEIVVIFEDKIDYPKETRDRLRDCSNEIIRAGIISKIKFYKDK